LERIDSDATMPDVPRRSRRLRRATRVWPWAFVLSAVVDLIAIRAHWVSHRPSILAGLFALAIVALGVRGVALGTSCRAAIPGRATAAAELLAIVGALITLGAGTANWLLGLQGYVILSQGESIRLQEGARLQAFVSGPLARVDEMDVVVTLDELDLVERGAGRYDPTSRIRVWRSHDRFDRLDVAPRTPGESGPLRFHQGAFGFAPRITIVHDGDPRREVFDRVVPFVTERRGPDGLAFHGEFSIASDDLNVIGRVDLDSLDEGLRGHATLWLDVDKGDHALGGGPLLPGHFAEIGDDYRVGFTDLDRWSEIVVSRRNYAGWMVPGVAVTLLGWVLWLPARWKRS
jgi:hypothetical protein